MEVDFRIDFNLWALPVMIAYDDSLGGALAISILCFHFEIYPNL